jgi:hypothetical protein
MKPPEEHPLLNELLSGPEVTGFREASLNHGLTALRHTRRRRRVLRGVALAALPVLLVSLVLLGGSMDRAGRDTTTVASPVIPSAPEQSRPSSVEYISDEELLALFPNQPLALVGPEGQQQLVFLDQALAN